MLCQNCKRNDAGVHLKRIVGGESAEIHLCSKCAAALGVRDAVTGFSPFGEILGSMMGSADAKLSGNRVLRCETCGFSFEDVARTGTPGCPDCYKTFSVKLRPTLVKLHGRAVFKGSMPENSENVTSADNEIAELKQRLETAIAEEDFENAAVLRDEIRALMREEKN